MSGIAETATHDRYQAVESALGTHAMEGLYPDSITRDFMKRYAEGGFTLPQFSAAMQAHARELVKELHPVAGAA